MPAGAAHWGGTQTAGGTMQIRAVYGSEVAGSCQTDEKKPS